MSGHHLTELTPRCRKLIFFLPQNCIVLHNFIINSQNLNLIFFFSLFDLNSPPPNPIVTAGSHVRSILYNVKL